MSSTVLATLSLLCFLLLLTGNAKSEDAVAEVLQEDSYFEGISLPAELLENDIIDADALSNIEDQQAEEESADDLEVPAADDEKAEAPAVKEEKVKEEKVKAPEAPAVKEEKVKEEK